MLHHAEITPLKEPTQGDLERKREKWYVADEALEQKDMHSLRQGLSRTVRPVGKLICRVHRLLVLLVVTCDRHASAIVVQ